jgi:hypothetical protein
MEKEFVSFDQAVALMYLGFDERCMAGYDEDFGKLYIGFSTDDGVLFNPTYHTLAPLKSQVFRWFREKYNLKSCIMFRHSMEDDKEYYDWLIKGQEVIYRHFTTYEEAENACIDKLIEIAKQQDK